MYLFMQYYSTMIFSKFTETFFISVVLNEGGLMGPVSLGHSTRRLVCHHESAAIIATSGPI